MIIIMQRMTKNEVRINGAVWKAKNYGSGMSITARKKLRDTNIGI